MDKDFKQFLKGSSIVMAILLALSAFTIWEFVVCHHDETAIDQRVEATCEETGLTEGKHCTLCNKILIKQEIIPALGHDVEITPEVKATCTKDGHTSGSKCKRCNKVLSMEEVTHATGHTIVKDEGVLPTETSTGLTEGKHCSTCNEVIVPQKVLPKTVLTLDKNVNVDKVIKQNDYRISFSNFVDSNDCLTILEHNGCILNEDSFHKINSIEISSSGDTDNLFLYVGDSLIPFRNPISVNDYIKYTSPNEFNNFVISYQGTSTCSIESIKIVYDYSFEEKKAAEIPVVNIETEVLQDNTHAKINSLDDYTRCTVSINGDMPLAKSSAGIRLRGNSTSSLPKKPYRIKFDSKQSLFGLTKAKNWVLLAEYMDGSSLHNYTVQNMVQQLDGFKCQIHMRHVEVILNGVGQGLYVLCENPDEKKGRLDIEQDLEEIANFDEMNFYLELTNINRLSKKTENVDYISVNNKCYEINYPKIDDFPDFDEKEKASEKFNQFVINLKDYMLNADSAMGTNDALEIEKYFDKKQLFYGALIDLISEERDHQYFSFKFYRDNSKKIKIGPMWDYDSVAFGFYVKSKPYDDPFKDCSKTNFVFPSNSWLEKVTSIPYFKTDFYSFVLNFLNNKFSKSYNAFISEYETVASQLILNCNLWQDSNMSIVFENLRYFDWYLLNRKDFLVNWINTNISLSNE